MGRHSSSGHNDPDTAQMVCADRAISCAVPETWKHAPNVKYSPRGGTYLLYEHGSG
jgi:hypothetical protein